MARLTKADAEIRDKKIYDLLTTTELSQNDIARQLKCSASTVNQIAKNIQSITPDLKHNLNNIIDLYHRALDIPEFSDLISDKIENAVSNIEKLISNDNIKE